MFRNGETSSTNGSCSFDIENAFIIDNESNYWKRKTKESVYSIINNSINKYNNIDKLWNILIHRNKTQIINNIKFKQNQVT